MNISRYLLCVLLLGAPVLTASEQKNDLHTPEVIDADPAPGKRVRAFLPEFKKSNLYHVLYLPTNWEKGKRYPVIVEYAGNQYKLGPGTPESCDLGYGISGGTGVIWVCLPYVDLKKKQNAPSWWGDVDATVDYCKKAVKDICTNYGGDTDRVFIAGFSRGAIACNFIGLHDEDIASLWRGFICHSHYDGVRNWGYKGADKSSAATRLARLNDRPQFICQEKSINAAKNYLAHAQPKGNFTFLALPFPEHTDTWLLRPSSERKILREWFTKHCTSNTQP